MKKILILLAVIFINKMAYSQTWYFGNNAGIKFTNSSGTWSVAPSAGSPLLSKVNTNEGCAVANDANGNALLYTDGTYIWDVQGNKIKTSLNADVKLNGFFSATQSGLIVPVPGSNCFEKYFVFGVPHIGTYGSTASGTYYEPCAPNNSISYTIVTKNSSGWVASPVLSITQDASGRLINAVTEKITAVGDGNKGYWILFHGFYNYSSSNSQSTCLTQALPDNNIGRRFFATHITSTNTGTVPAPIASDIAPMISREREHTLFWANGAQGQLKFSRDGTKIAMATCSAHEIYVYKFNKTTGQVTSVLFSKDNFTGSSSAANNALNREYGVEFSPSGQYLYISKEHENNSDKGVLSRYDLSKPTPTEELVKTSPSIRFGQLQLGPDNNIYLAYPGQTKIGQISKSEEASPLVTDISITGASVSGLPTLIQNEMICGVAIVDVVPTSTDPCCPPWNKDLLKSMMFYQGSGSISDPYTLHFQPTTALKNQVQAYINYLHSLNPLMSGITIDWRLHDQGTGNLPSTGFGLQIGSTANVTWNWNTNGIGNPVVPVIFTGFPMQVGTWYVIHTETSLANGQTFFPASCANNDIFVRIQVMNARTSGRPVLEFSDGKKVIKTVSLQ